VRRRFLLSEYPKDWSDPDPTSALTSALLSGKLKVHLEQHELTELEIGAIIHGGLWSHKELWVHPEDVKKLPVKRPARKRPFLNRGECDQAARRAFEDEE
jgi:hypothetical protein